MCIMTGDVEYSCWPTKVPFVCREEYSGFESGLKQIYYRFVPLSIWLALRKICH